MHPASGGIYVFLREGFGAPTAFVFGWSYMLLSKPLAAAGIAVIFAENLNLLLGSSLSPVLITCAVIILLTAINVMGMRLGAGVAMVLTSAKFLALLAIIGLTLILFRGDASGFATRTIPDARPFWAAMVPVMAAILWTYDGWSDIGAIAGEVRNPQRTIPLGILLAILLTAVVYGAVAVMTLGLIGPDALAVAKAPLIEAAKVSLGPVAVPLIASAAALSIIKTMNSTALVFSRSIFAMARSGSLPASLAAIHPRFGTPHRSVIACYVLAMLGL
jgi:APA family basic amino acid/polyamine antiporter